MDRDGRLPATVARRAAEPAALVAALRDLSNVGPYFALGTGPLVDGGWLPVRTLSDDLSALAGLTSRVATAIGTDETRVGASILLQGYSARLWSLELGLLVRHALVADLDPDLLLWRDHAGSLCLHLAVVGGWRGEGLDDAVAETVVGRQLGPLVAAVRRLCSLSDRLLWDDVASALLGTARVLDGGPTGPAHLAAARVWSLAGVPDDASPLFRTGRRGTCCLYYRVPGGGLCGDCVFTSPPAVGTRRA